jgi:hypothetical protein
MCPSDPASTDVKMGTTWCWFRKLKYKAHLINPQTDRTWCKVENARASFEKILRGSRSTVLQEGRIQCRNCLDKQEEHRARTAL